MAPRLRAVHALAGWVWLSSLSAFAQDAGVPQELPAPAAAPAPTPAPEPQAAPPSADAPPATDVSEVSLDELLNTELAVASRKLLTPRESPGIVSVVTREELMAAGARDLVDVLHQVQGFSFGVDVSGVVGVGFRGVWGHEGKVLLLVDGLEMNEPLYSTTQFGHELPVDQIERVEIIRGPGSAVYGGFAELAVINVITRGAGLKGVYVGGTAGVTPAAFAEKKLSFQVGHTLLGQDGLKLSLSGALGEGLRSDGKFTDLGGSAYELATESRMDSRYLNLAAQWRGLRARVLVHQLGLDTRDGYDAVLAATAHQRFNSFLAEVAWDAVPVEGLVVTPRLTWKRQTPWGVEDKGSDLFYAKTVDRLVAGLSASYDILSNLNVQAGVEATFDQARLDDLELAGSQTLFNAVTDEDGNVTGEPTVAYRNLALYAQVLFPNPIVNVTAGVRYELHSVFGPSFVPRVGLTKVLGRFHFKLLYANAFRAPGVENISLGTNVTPERTSVLEGELGVQLTDNLYAAVNAFDLTLADPIVYAYDPATDSESYRNFTRTGSRGLEAEVRARYRAGSLRLSYSFYSPGGKNTVDSYEVPGHPEALLGFAAHKLTAQGSLTVIEDLAITPTLVFLSSRYGVTGLDADGAYVVTDLGPAVLLDLYVQKTNLFGQRGLEAGIGIHNLTRTDFRVVQPYASGHLPLPMLPLEIMLRVGLTHDFGS